MKGVCMNENVWNSIVELDPEKIKEQNKPFVSEGYQKFRNQILERLKYLSFSERFNIIKKTDKELLLLLNKYNGTKAVHTLDYIKKFPSRKKDLTLREELILQIRSFMMIYARNDYYKERRKKMIRVIK